MTFQIISSTMIHSLLMFDVNNLEGGVPQKLKSINVQHYQRKYPQIMSCVCIEMSPVH